MLMGEGDLINLNVGEDVAFEVLAVPGGWVFTRQSKSNIVGGVPQVQGIVYVPRPFQIGANNAG